MGKVVAAFVGVVAVALLGSSVSEASRIYGTYSRRRVNPTTRRLNDVEKLVTSLQDDVMALQDAVYSPPAGFTAIFKADSAPIPKGGSPVVFPEAVVYGDVYDTTTGVFVVPTNGLYSLTLSVAFFDVQPPTSSARAFVVRRRAKDQAETAFAVVTSSHDDVSSSGSVVYLTAADEVFVQINTNASIALGSNFRGFLVSAVTLEGPADQLGFFTPPELWGLTAVA